MLQKKTQSDDDALFFVVSFSVYFGSDEDAERAEKTERGERFFVGCDREVRRYLFQTYPSETESNGCEILVRSEYGDEEID